MNKLYKKDGREMLVNDNSLSAALALGWVLKSPTLDEQPKKRGRKRG